MNRNGITAMIFDEWLRAYGQASKDSDPHATAGLFAENARYYETPFSQPMIGRDAIYDYWAKAARTLRDKESTYEILCIEGNCGIARWQGQFTSTDSGRRFALDCIFVVEFDKDDRCSMFREWWHSETTFPKGE